MRFFTIALIFLLPGVAHSQMLDIDSLRPAFNTAADGNPRYKAANYIYMYYQESNRDSALFYTEQQLQVARRAHHKIAEGMALGSKSYQLMAVGRYADALVCLQQAFIIAEDENNEKEEPWDYFITPFKGNGRLLLLSYTHHMYALLMISTEDLQQQIVHFRLAGEIGKQVNYFPRILLADMNLGQSYLNNNQPDSALYYEKRAELSALDPANRSFFAAKTYLGTIELILGDIYKVLKEDSLSLSYYYRGMQTSVESNNRSSLSRVYLRLSGHHLEKGNKVPRFFIR